MTSLTCRVREAGITRYRAVIGGEVTDKVSAMDDVRRGADGMGDTFRLR